MTTLLQIGVTWLLQSSTLLGFGLLALWFARRRGPIVQTLIGRATLTSVPAALLLILSLNGHVRPLWRVSFATPPAVEAASPPLLPVPDAAPSPNLPSSTFASSAAPREEALPSAQNSPALPPPSGETVLSPRHAQLPLLVPILAATWGLGTAVLLFWLALCEWHLIRLSRAARRLTSGSAFDTLISLSSRPPRLLCHPAVGSPFLAGIRQPAIFLPAAYETDFDLTALLAILAHELAHVRRRDCAWTLAARLFCALLWPQPLLWLLCRRLEAISEEACDLAVLAHACPPRAYADCLLTLAERHALPRRERTLSVGVVPFRSQLGLRVQRILAKGTYAMSPISTRLRLTIATLTFATVVGGAFLVSSAPAQTQGEMPKAPAGASVEKNQEKILANQEMMHLRAISTALIKYEADFHGKHFPYGYQWTPDYHVKRYPDADHWMDEILPYLSDRSVLYAPSHTATRRYGYAFNRNFSKQLLRDVKNPELTVTVFPSTLGTKNAADAGQSLRIISGASQVDIAGSYYGFADGHVKWLQSNLRPSFLLGGDRIARHRVGFSAPIPQMNEAQFLAGLTPVQGPGVVVTLTDSRKTFPQKLPANVPPPSLIHDTDINQVVNELKAAGAEAIAVSGQRLVATSAIRCAGPTIFVNNTPQSPPYVIKAIGDPKALLAALQMQGGIASMIRQFDPAMFSAQVAARVTLPAFNRQGMPRFAKPVSQPSPAKPLGKEVRLTVLLAQLYRLSAEMGSFNGQAIALHDSFVYSSGPHTKQATDKANFQWMKARVFSKSLLAKLKSLDTQIQAVRREKA